MHRPVGAAALAELVRAVERVDDPHPIGSEAATVVGAFFREHDIVGPSGGDRVEQEPVGGSITRVHDLPRVSALVPQLLAELHEQRARLDREARRERWSSSVSVTGSPIAARSIGAGPIASSP